MFRAIGVIIVGLMFAGQALACTTVDEVTKDFIEGNPGVKVAAHIDGDSAEQFMAAANAFTNSQRPEREILIFTGEGYLTHVVLFKDGCATGVGNFPPQLVEEWLHGLAG